MVDIKTGKSKEEPPVKKRDFSRFMTKGQYALLSDEDKAAYLDRFPGSTHKIKPPRIKARPGRHDMDFIHDMSDEEADSFHAQLMEEIDGLNTENRASINRESIGAMNDVSTDDLKEGAEDLKNNAEEVADDVAKRFANRPKLLAKGLSSIRKLWGGEEEPSPKEKRHAADTLTQITKYALLGAGIAALAVAASPAAFVIAHIMMETYGRGFLEKKKIQDDERYDKLKDENSKIKDENTTMKAAERDRKAQIKARQKALLDEEKKRKEEEEERQEEIKERQENPTGDDIDDTNEAEQDVPDSEKDDDEEKVEDDKPDMKVAASADSFEHTHEDDQNTLTEVIRHIGEFLDNNTADDIRNHMRVALGDKANHLVSESASSYRCIEDLAVAMNGQIEGNFVVTASSRYVYNESTGRYGNATD